MYVSMYVINDLVCKRTQLQTRYSCTDSDASDPLAFFYFFFSLLFFFFLYLSVDIADLERKLAHSDLNTRLGSTRNKRTSNLLKKIMYITYLVCLFE